MPSPTPAHLMRTPDDEEDQPDSPPLRRLKRNLYFNSLKTKSLKEQGSILSLHSLPWLGHPREIEAATSLRDIMATSRYAILLIC